MQRFYLGTHETSWLERLDDVPLFISHRRLKRYKRRLPRARCPWALDSGGFTELSMHGRWTVSVTEYVEAVARYGEEIGRLEWAAPMDWMCEPSITAQTGLKVRDHQERTVENFLEIRDQGPFIPVLQGWAEDDYHACADLYAEAGIDLTAEPLVGVGTVCRRQHTDEIRQTMTALAGRGLQLHGFGVKKLGLPPIAHLIESADSMAWSTRGRMAWQHDHVQLCGHATHPGSCANCSAWALKWRGEIFDSLGIFAPQEVVI